jgi:hypothetical protein
VTLENCTIDFLRLLAANKREDTKPPYSQLVASELRMRSAFRALLGTRGGPTVGDLPTYANQDLNVNTVDEAAEGTKALGELFDAWAKLCG